MDGNDHFYCRSFCRHSRRVLEQYRQFADIRRTLRTCRTCHFVLQLRNGNYYKCYKNAELNHKALYTPNIRGFKIIIGGINMKTKQILYLCITGLIIAMIILSILPVWTFTNYPTASAATEEEVNTNYNSTIFDDNKGIFIEKNTQENTYYPQFQINHEMTISSITVNTYMTNTSTETDPDYQTFRIVYKDENEKITQYKFLEKGYNNITIDVNLKISAIYLETTVAPGKEINIILGEFTVFDGTTTYGYYYPEAKSLLNSLYENAYNDGHEKGEEDGEKTGYENGYNQGYNDGININLSEKITDLNNYAETEDIIVDLFGSNFTYISENFEGKPVNQGTEAGIKNASTDPQIQQALGFMISASNAPIYEDINYFLTWTNMTNVKSIDIGYSYTTNRQNQTPQATKYKLNQSITLKSGETKFKWDINTGYPYGPCQYFGSSYEKNDYYYIIRIIPENPAEKTIIENFQLWIENKNLNSYELGYQNGHNIGYNEGYNDGISQTLDNVTGFEIITSGFKGVFEALDVDIFYGKVSLVDIFNIFFIIMVVTAVLSIIRG